MSGEAYERVAPRPEAETWLAEQPRKPGTRTADNPDGKVDIAVLIQEGRRRGYCICPRPLRQVVDVRGLTCKWCDQPETDDSWRFWYGSPADAG